MVREQALDGDRAPVQRALEHHRAARAVAEHRRSDFQAPDARRAANARMRRGSFHARFVVVLAFVFTRARRRLFFSPPKGGPPRERRVASAAASLLPPRAPLLLAGDDARVLRDGVLDGVLDARPGSAHARVCGAFRRHRRAPAPRAATTVAAPTPRPAAAESATVAAAVKARRDVPRVRPRSPRTCRRQSGSSACTPTVRAVQERPAARGVRRRGEPLRHARPVVLRRARRHRDRRPRLAETRAQQSDQPSVLVTLVRSLVEGDASPRWPFDARLGPGSAYRPPACAPTKTSAPPPSPRRGRIRRAESLKRGKRRRRERPGPSRCYRRPGDDVIVTAFPLSKRSVGKSSLPSESRSGSTRRRSRRARPTSPRRGDPGSSAGAPRRTSRSTARRPSSRPPSAPYTPCAPRRRRPGARGRCVLGGGGVQREDPKSASPSASPGAACITTPSAVNVSSSVPRSASSAKTTLVRVPSTSAPSRVMDGDASTSCRP